MIKTLTYHKVEDFSKWKKAFDRFSNFRKTSGEQGYSVGTLHGEPNTSFVINKWESFDSFKKFIESKELAEAMKSAGVLEAPHTIILNELEKG